MPCRCRCRPGRGEGPTVAAVPAGRGPGPCPAPRPGGTRHGRAWTSPEKALGRAARAAPPSAPSGRIGGSGRERRPGAKKAQRSAAAETPPATQRVVHEPLLAAPRAPTGSALRAGQALLHPPSPRARRRRRGAPDGTRPGGVVRIVRAAARRGPAAATAPRAPPGSVRGRPARPPPPPGPARAAAPPWPGPHLSRHVVIRSCRIPAAGSARFDTTAVPGARRPLQRRPPADRGPDRLSRPVRWGVRADRRRAAAAVVRPPPRSAQQPTRSTRKAPDTPCVSTRSPSSSPWRSPTC